MSSAGSEGTLRLFVAWELPDDWRAALVAEQRRLQRRLGARASRLRWVAEEALHLTLIFLGDAPVGAEAGMKSALASAAAGVPRFQLSLGVAGSFGGARPRVIRCAVEGDLEALGLLHQRACLALGRPLERQRFAAHITLARVRQGAIDGRAIVEALAGSRSPDCEPAAVEALSLMRSELLPAGPRYSRRSLLTLLQD
jgi:2'-5' RNA ligase